MRRRLALVLLALACAASALVVGGAGPATAALPAQASPVAHAHAHTHGPDPIDLAPRDVAAAAPYQVDTPAPWSVTDVDGATPTEDTVDLRSNLPLVHAVYLHPSDRDSRFGQFAAMFEADARDAARKLESAYGRSIRWDERGRQDARSGLLVDITVLKSRHTYVQLSNSANQFNLVDAELKERLPGGNKKYVAWLDADSDYCGQGTLYNDTRRAASNYNELRTTGIVYRPYSPDDASGGFCRGRTLLHELGHNFGALQGSRTPNDFDGAHCDDSAEDVMCYVGAAERRLGTRADTGGPVFDYRNDDYWDAGAKPGQIPTARKAKLAWWTVNLSKYLCPTTSAGSPNCALPNSNPGY
jgi:hypothetical protein